MGLSIQKRPLHKVVSNIFKQNHKPFKQITQSPSCIVRGSGGGGGAGARGSSESFCIEVQNEQLMQSGTKIFLTAVGYVRYVEIWSAFHLGNGYVSAVCNAQVHEGIF